MGTALGQELGWRSTFWAVTVLGVIRLLGIVFLVPRQEAQGGDLRSELAVFRNPQLWLALLMTAFVFIAHSPVPAAITIVLFGAAGFATVPPLQMRVMQTAAGALLAVGGLAIAVVSVLLERRVSSGTAPESSEARQKDRKIVPVAN